MLAKATLMPSVQHIVAVYRSDFGSIQCQHADCLARKSEELDGVAAAIVVDVDDGADIAGTKTVLGKVLRQDSAIVFGDVVHGSLSFTLAGRSGVAGYAVTRCGTELPSAINQTVRTMGIDERGVANCPTREYEVPNSVWRVSAT